MKAVVTGAEGFLGWHTRVRLTTDGVDYVGIEQEPFWTTAMEEAVSGLGPDDVVIHIAGVNRAATPEDVRDGNIVIADRLVEALTSTGSRARVVYAGSIQSDGLPSDLTPYGVGKLDAATRLRDWAAAHGGSFAEVRFPGLYGEHGRPDYNSFVATFAHRIAAGESPQVTGDRTIPLLHVQDAVSALLEAASGPAQPLIRPALVTPLGISDVRDRLTHFKTVYATGEIPDLTDRTDVRLFNTLRAALWDRGERTITLTPHSDARGTLVESVRQHGGQGQTFFSTSHPGVTRGDHFHYRKVERFQVVSGTGVIRLRRMLTDDVVEIPVSGDAPVAVDMPTLWTHSISNVGGDDMLTIFWINELFDPADADTHYVKVLP